MDYSNHHARGRYKSDLSGWSRILLAAFILLVLGGSGFLIYEYKTNQAFAARFTEYHGRISAWLAERKKNMHHGIASKVRTNAAEHESEEQDVNFEFYNTLQDMQSMEREAQVQAQHKLDEKSLAETKARLPAVKTETARLTTAKKTDSTIKKPKTKINASDIESELLAAMKAKSGV